MQADKPGTISAAVALSCIGVFGVLAAPILANTLGASLQLGAEDIGKIIGAEIGGGAAASLLATLWIHRVNWRLASALAIAAVVIINFLSGMQSDPNVLAGLRFLAGFLGQGTAFAVAIGIINTTSNHDRVFGFSIASQVSIGVLTLLVLPSLGEQFGVNGVLLPLAGLALLALPLLLWVPARSARSVGAHGASGTGASPVPAFTALGVLLLWCTGLGAMWAFLLQIGVAGGLEADSAGQALAISTTVGISGALIASALAGRGGRLVPVAAALLIQIAAILLLSGEMNFVRFAATCAVFQTFWNFTGPYLMGMVSEFDKTGRIAVLIPVAQTGGFALGPVFAGAMMTNGDLGAANTVGIAGCILALIVFVPVALTLRRPAATA